jgi:hypothetical protein
MLVRFFEAMIEMVIAHFLSWLLVDFAVALLQEKYVLKVLQNKKYEKK